MSEPGMEEVARFAEQLGSAIGGHERCIALKKAVEALHADAEAKRLETEYAAASRVLQEKAQNGEPLEPEEKRLEAGLRKQVASNATIREFLRAQADFQQLMNVTNTALEDAIGLDKPEQTD